MRYGVSNLKIAILEIGIVEKEELTNRELHYQLLFPYSQLYNIRVKGLNISHEEKAANIHWMLTL